ncbi:MAG: ATP-binding protein [Polyangiaceae bacterium]|nr:ATP-binding protein [Polyangiaceae bacterium]
MSAPGKTALEPRTFDIGSEHERFWCAAEGKRYAAAIGFDPTAQGEVAICIAELASNVAKFAGRGTITLSMVDDGRIGLRIVVEDAGPGVTDPATVMQDGFSEGRRLDPGTPRRTGQGLGVGLGAVSRMMNHVEIVNVPQHGLRVVATKWLDNTRRSGMHRMGGPPSNKDPGSNR